MNRGRQSGGYTIVETLIFLAVSGAMFVSAMAAISGRQGRTEFSNASREFEIKMQDLANDVATGYYSNPATSGGFLRCTAAGASINVSATSGTDSQGSNRDCIFIGKTLQLGVSGANDTFVAVPLAGKREIALGTDVSSFTESTVRPLGASSPVDISESNKLRAFEFSCTMYATAPGTPLANTPCTSAGFTRTDNVTFMTTFVGINVATQNRESDDTKVDLLVHAPAGAVGPAGRSKADIVGEVRRYSTVPTALNPSPIVPVVNPAGGIYICLNSTVSNQYALLKLGGQGSRFGTNLTIQNGRCL